MKNIRTLMNNKATKKGEIGWQDAMEDAGRKAEMDALFTMFSRIQGMGSDVSAIDIAGQEILSRAGKSVLGFRLSTMMVQPASYPMAFTVIPQKYSKTGTALRGGAKVQTGQAQADRVDKFSAILRMRHVGGRTNIVTGDFGAKHSVPMLMFRQHHDISLEGMRQTDRKTILEIDKAVQRWVADTTKLQPGTDAFWEEVAIRTEDVVRQTQPMWDMDERSVLSSTKNPFLKSTIMFRAAREAMLNQNLRAIDALAKGTPDSKKEFANTMAMTTLSTVLVRGIKTALYTGTTIGAAAILRRERKEIVPEEEAEKFLVSLGTDMMGHLPFGQFAAGAIKKATGTKAWQDLDPDAIMFAAPVMIAESIPEYRKAYEAWVIDRDGEKLAEHLISATEKLSDGLVRFKGYPVSGIQQITSSPMRRALQEPQPFEMKTKTPERIMKDLEEKLEKLKE